MILKKKIKLTLISLLVLVMSSFITYAIASNNNKDDGRKTSKYEEELRHSNFSIKDHKKADSLIVVLYNENIIKAHTNLINDFILLDSLHLEKEEYLSKDDVYKERLDIMPSVIRLPYNKIVRNYIDRYIRKGSGMSTVLGLSLYYMPIFEEELHRQGLPIELRILPIVESSLNTRAISGMGAAGLWQFMYPTGRHYGLRVNSFIDERLDPIASTKAACKYLKDLYNIYEDWTLVLAAYNCGPGNVNKAIRRAPKAKNFWDVYYYLPSETRNYVPAFIGASYAYTFHKNHDIEMRMPQFAVLVDTMKISNMMFHLEQVSSTIDIPLNTLRMLNPMYKLDIIPAVAETANLVIPMDKVMDFIDNEEEIYAKSSLYMKEYTNPEDMQGFKDGFVLHRVKSGEVLGTIANKYRTKVSSIMKWNNIKSSKYIKVGQKLKIFL